MKHLELRTSAREESMPPSGGMSRRRFLLLAGAGIVGLNTGAFFKRSRVNAAPLVTPDQYAGGPGELDSDDHTELLIRMFNDSALVAPFAFHLPRCPNGRGWIFRLDSPVYTPLKVKSNWTCTSARLADGSFDPLASIVRQGTVPMTPYARSIFLNADPKFGNSNIRLNVRCDGDKQEAARASGGTYSVDDVGFFFHLVQRPNMVDGQFFYNKNVNISNSEVVDWPGITFNIQVSEKFVAQYLTILRSHRDSLTLWHSHISPTIRYNTILDCGDDCLALRPTDKWVRAMYGDNYIPPPIIDARVSHNTLSQKRRMDLPQPAGDRVGSANCGINIAGNVQKSWFNGNRILYTFDGDDPASPGDVPRPAINLAWEAPDLYPTDIRINNLTIDKTRAPGVWARDKRITGSLNRARIATFQRWGTSYPWNCSWIIPPSWERSKLKPVKASPTV